MFLDFVNEFGYAGCFDILTQWIVEGAGKEVVEKAVIEVDDDQNEYKKAEDDEEEEDEDLEDSTDAKADPNDGKPLMSLKRLDHLVSQFAQASCVLNRQKVVDVMFPQILKAVKNRLKNLTEEELKGINNQPVNNIISNLHYLLGRTMLTDDRKVDIMMITLDVGIRCLR